MAQYRVYLSSDEDRSLRQVARRLNQRPQDTLRGLVAQLARGEEWAALEPKIATLQTQLEAVFSILEIAAAEVGFLSGMTRASTKDKENLARAGATLENQIRQVAARLRREAKATSPSHVEGGKTDS